MLTPLREELRDQVAANNSALDTLIVVVPHVGFRSRLCGGLPDQGAQLGTETSSQRIRARRHVERQHEVADVSQEYHLQLFGKF